MYKRDLLLKEAVHPLAKFLNYEVFQDYTCERANIFFQTIIKPLHERSSEDKGGEDVVRGRLNAEAAVVGKGTEVVEEMVMVAEGGWLVG